MKKKAARPAHVECPQSAFIFVPPRAALLLPELNELRQFCLVQVGNCPVLEVGVLPTEQVETLERAGFDSAARLSRGGPDKEIDDVIAVAVDEGSGRSAGDVVQTASGEREAFRGKVPDRRGEVQLAVEPGFDGVLISGGHIEEMVAHERTDVAGSQFADE